MKTFSSMWQQRVGRLVLAFVLVGTVAVAQNKQEPNDREPEPFSEAIVQELVRTVRNGLVAHDADKMLSAFGGMRDYSQFAEQVRTFFSLYENFRVYYRIVEVATVECSNAKSDGTLCGRAVIELQLQGDDSHNGVPGVARSGQLHLGFERLRDGWRITDINREFFR
jgi:hypothetical protein